MSRTAALYRLVTPEHICPFGLKSKDLLERKGFEVEDHHLSSKAEADALEAKLHVETTPQTFIEGERVGGYDELRDYFDMSEAKPEGKTYVPVIASFSMAALMAAALTWYRSSAEIAATSEELWRGLLVFVALSMCILAIQKLQNLFAFTNRFLGYDLLAQRFVPYAFVYPFAEAYAGIGMLAGFPAWSVAPVALFIGAVGAVSVWKAVFVEKRELKCACVGGSSNVPLGAVSLVENGMMVAAGIAMLVASV